MSGSGIGRELKAVYKRDHYLRFPSQLAEEAQKKSVRFSRCQGACDAEGAEIWSAEAAGSAEGTHPGQLQKLAQSVHNRLALNRITPRQESADYLTV